MYACIGYGRHATTLKTLQTKQILGGVGKTVHMRYKSIEINIKPVLFLPQVCHFQGNIPTIPIQG